MSLHPPTTTDKPASRKRKRQQTPLDRAKRSARGHWRELFRILAPSVLEAPPRCPLCGGPYRHGPNPDLNGKGACNRCGRFSHGTRLLRRIFKMPVNETARHLLATIKLYALQGESKTGYNTGGR